MATVMPPFAMAGASSPMFAMIKRKQRRHRAGQNNGLGKHSISCVQDPFPLLTIGDCYRRSCVSNNDFYVSSDENAEMLFVD